LEVDPDPAEVRPEFEIRRVGGDESVYRRYAIVSAGDLREAGLKLAESRPVGDSLGS
jgi:hypothetical protein